MHPPPRARLYIGAVKTSKNEKISKKIAKQSIPKNMETNKIERIKINGIFHSWRCLDPQKIKKNIVLGIGWKNFLASCGCAQTGPSRLLSGPSYPTIWACQNGPPCQIVPPGAAGWSSRPGNSLNRSQERCFLDFLERPKKSKMMQFIILSLMDVICSIFFRFSYIYSRRGGWIDDGSNMIFRISEFIILSFW